MNFSDHLDEQIRLERLKEVAEGTGIEARRARYNLRRAQVKDPNYCPAGHEYSEQNTYIEAGRGRRRCLTCHAAQRVYIDRANHGRDTYAGQKVIDLKPFLGMEGGTDA